MDRDRQDFLDGATVLILRATIPIFFVWFPNKCIKNTNIDGKNKACDSIKSRCGDDPSLFPNYLLCLIILFAVRQRYLRNFYL